MAQGATVELRSAVLRHGDNHVARATREVEPEDTAETTRRWNPNAYVVMHPRLQALVPNRDVQAAAR